MSTTAISKANVRSGGHFRLSYDAWHDQQDFGFSYRDLRFEALHAFPIFDKKRVFIARVIAQSLDSPAGNDRAVLRDADARRIDDAARVQRVPVPRHATRS